MRYFLALLLVLFAGCGRKKVISDDNDLVTLDIPSSFNGSTPDGIDWSLSPPHWKNAEPQTHRIRLTLNRSEALDSRIQSRYMHPGIYGINPTMLQNGTYSLEIRNKTTDSHSRTNFTVPSTVQIIIKTDPAGFIVNTNIVMIHL